MGKAAQVLKLVRKINVGRMFDTAREISQQTGKNRLAVLTDIVWCGIKYSAGYMDYKFLPFTISTENSGRPSSPVAITTS